MIQKILTLLALVLLTACSHIGEYHRFYTQQAPERFAPTEYVTCVYAADADAEYKKAYQDFMIIGRLDYNGVWEGAEIFLEYGQHVGADIVIFSRGNRSEKTVNSSITMPTVETGTVSGTASDGSSYSGTVTTYGTKQIPYSYDVVRFDLTAIYLKRVKGAKAPWEHYRKDFQPDDSSSEFTGRWSHDGTQIDIILVDGDYLGFLAGRSDSAIEGLQRSFEKAKVPWQGWHSGELKMSFNPRTMSGYLIDAFHERVDGIAFSINKFDQLELKFPDGSTIAYAKKQ